MSGEIKTAEVIRIAKLMRSHVSLRSLGNREFEIYGFEEAAEAVIQDPATVNADIDGSALDRICNELGCARDSQAAIEAIRDLKHEIKAAAAGIDNLQGGLQQLAAVLGVSIESSAPPATNRSCPSCGQGDGYLHRSGCALQQKEPK